MIKFFTFTVLFLSFAANAEFGHLECDRSYFTWSIKSIESGGFFSHIGSYGSVQVAEKLGLPNFLVDIESKNGDCWIVDLAADHYICAAKVAKARSYVPDPHSSNYIPGPFHKITDVVIEVKKKGNQNVITLKSSRVKGTNHIETEYDKFSCEIESNQE